MTSPPFRLKLLGPPLVEAPSGEVVELPQGKPLALLIYLAVTGTPLPRDDAAQLLWPGASPDRARGSLRQAIWLLRNRLSPEIFTSDDPLAVAPEVLETDLQAFQGLLGDGDVDAASELWQGTPLDGMVLPDAPEWSRWADALRSEAEEALAEGLANLAQRDRISGRPEQGVARLRAAMEIQPGRLVRHMELVEALLDLRDFEQAAALLAEGRLQFEGMEDLESIRLLEDRIRVLRRGQAGGRAEDAPLRLEFVGRSEEFAALVRRWRQAKGGTTAVGLIAGEDGMGRTRLAEEVALLAQTEGGRIVHVRAEDSERPFQWGLLGELVHRLFSLSGAAGISPASDRILRSLVPSLTLGDPPPTAPFGAGLGDDDATGGTQPSAPLLDALQDLVKAVADDSPLILLVDDIHWADADSRAVLGRLATGLRGASVFFLLTCDASTEDPGVLKTLSLLQGGAHSTVIRLERWTREEVSEALGWMARFSKPGEAERLIERIYLASRGVPYFVLELLKVFRQEGILEIPDRGGWIFRVERLQGVLPFPETLQLRVQQELERLSVPSLLLLRELAADPDPRPIELISRQTGITGRSLADSLAELESRRMILWKGERQLTIPHEGLRMAVLQHPRREAVPPPSRERAHWSRLALAGATLLLLLTAGSYFFLENATATGPTPAVGGGSLFISHSGGVVELRAPVGRPVGWESVRRTGWTPTSPGTQGPFRTTDGELHWFENRTTSSEPSWIVDRGTDGSESVPVRSNRTEEFRALSPDGRFILFTAERRQADTYRQNLWIARRDGSSPRLLYSAEDIIRGGSWSADGLRLSFAVQGRQADTVLVLTPDGSELARREVDQFLDADWCGAGDLVLTAIQGGSSALLRWQPGLDELHTIGVPGMVGGPVTCSPDSAYAALLVGLEGAASLMAVGLGAAEAHLIPIPVGIEAQSIRWVPDRLDPVPVGVRIVADGPLMLEWGGRRQLEAEVLFSDGLGRRQPVGWLSQNSQVASVNLEGTLTANRAGSTKIFAQFDGWLVDSIPLFVTGDAPFGTLLREEFQLLDLARWTPVGDPIPIPDELRGEPILRLRGDGQGWDGIVSSTPLSLPQGGTLEAEFLLYPTDLMGQEIRLCLLDGDPPAAQSAGEAARNLREWTIRQEICFRYPAGERIRTDRTRAEFWSHSGFLPALGHVDRHLPSTGWFHVAITLRPDGAPHFFVNREPVGTATPRIRMEEGARWRVGVFGADLEADAMVRSLTLWPGVRY